MDYLADLVIHGFIDDVIKIVMKKLALDIPVFKLSRWAKLLMVETKSSQSIKVDGIDKSGCPFEIFTAQSTKMIDT